MKMHYHLIAHGCAVFIVVNARGYRYGHLSKMFRNTLTRISVYLNYERETDQSEMSPTATLGNVITIFLNSSPFHFQRFSRFLSGYRVFLSTYVQTVMKSCNIISTVPTSHLKWPNIRCKSYVTR